MLDQHRAAPRWMCGLTVSTLFATADHPIANTGIVTSSGAIGADQVEHRGPVGSDRHDHHGVVLHRQPSDRASVLDTHARSTGIDADEDRRQHVARPADRHRAPGTRRRPGPNASSWCASSRAVALDPQRQVETDPAPHRSGRAPPLRPHGTSPTRRAATTRARRGGTIPPPTPSVRTTDRGGRRGDRRHGRHRRALATGDPATPSSRPRIRPRRSRPRPTSIDKSSSSPPTGIAADEATMIRSTAPPDAERRRDRDRRLRRGRRHRRRRRSSPSPSRGRCASGAAGDRIQSATSAAPSGVDERRSAGPGAVPPRSSPRAASGRRRHARTVPGRPC